MKTTVINSTKENNKLNSKAINGKTDGKSEHSKANGLPVSKDLDRKKNETVQKKTETLVKVAQPTKVETNITETDRSNTIQIQGTSREQLPKPALSLESTLQLVEELHRRKIQRDKLMSTINTLEEFEVLQLDDAEETHSNHFQGCELTIVDDNRRDFSTKNPFIIQKVAEYINALCLDRLAEIEGEIIIPA